MNQSTDDTTSNWYVLHTYSGQEERVRRNLENRIESLDVQNLVLNVVVPTEEQIEIKGGEKKTVTKKVFPGYILVEMVMDDRDRKSVV